ncbi:hypothetical protein AB0D86_23850 [Streptomyces sp. NPDC048324]|uniref:hypothetical protein n=1 Tax=Streptomyces sp. NPDC048324 TaxID=3157205 RepID=UPI0034296AB9
MGGGGRSWRAWCRVRRAERPKTCTRLSIIGWRELPLCRACDADALKMSISDNTPVPSDYVAACLGSAGAGSTTHTPHAAPATPPPAPNSAPATTVKPAAIAKSSSGPPTRQRPQPGRPEAAPSASVVPTVRQAIAAFMGEAPGQADAKAMLLLGTCLGSHNRLGVLEEDGAGDRLCHWCHGHWGTGGDRAERAVGTICRAVDFWGARGWLAFDPAARLR